MWEAAVFAAIGQAALIVGALLVWRFPSLTRPAAVGALMAFGAGAVISAVSTDLVAVAYDEAGAGPTALGIAGGALGYYAIINLLERGATAERERLRASELGPEEGEVTAATPTEARNLFVGMIIDGIPESVAIGLSMHMAMVGVSVALVGSVFAAGLPEAIGVSAALFAGGYGLLRVLARFSVVVLVGAVSGAIGFQSMIGARPNLVAVIQSVAAGALILVAVNEMVPIANRGVQRRAGLFAAAGFVFSAALTWASGSG